MKVKWLGHACFLVTALDGTRTITDPYATSERLTYALIQEAADNVLVSHEHGDHNNVAAIKGNPQIIRMPGNHRAHNIEVLGISTYHDDTQGSQRGPNTVFVFIVDRLRLCHLGDLGHPLTPEQIEEIGALDVLFVPVGGTATIDALGATQLCDRLKPRVVIPMHYKTQKCSFPFAGVEPFLEGRARVRLVEGSESELLEGKMPPPTDTLVLEHAL